MQRPRRMLGFGLTVLAVLTGARPAEAQLDPLLPLKTVPPNVIVVLDTSASMLTDGTGDYYDPMTYLRTNDPAVASALGVPVGSTQYRRIYRALVRQDVAASPPEYVATDILAVPVSSPAFGSFWAETRLELAKAALVTALRGLDDMVRWRLLRFRQSQPAWRSAGNCDQPVTVTGNGALSTVNDTNPCAVPGMGQFGISAPSTAGAGFLVPTSGVATGAVGASNAAALVTLAQRPIQDPLGIIPAGQDTGTYVDRPLTLALTDARALAVGAMNADGAATRVCRNTVIVLLTGGADSGDSAYVDTHDPVAVAGTFTAVQAGNGSGQVTRRVPIVVVGLRPDAADENELMGIATASGGRYFAAQTVGDVTYALNYAAQLGFQQSADLDLGLPSEYAFVSPIVGTVNLVGATDANGSSLPNTEILSTTGPSAGQVVPQRSNMLLTGGFALPSFDGRLRAFRTFRPEPDATKPTGWRFVQDGSRLWPDLDGRPELAGTARTPASPGDRNIYTYIPSGRGSGTIVAFSAAESATLAPHLGGADPAELIPFIRNLPLGAIIGSTPAIMDAPSLDPPPDQDYGFAETPGSYANLHQDRRSIIFVGANDGMVHAIDARTGYEVWAFIPYNLLPKLQALTDGQSVEEFDYFVDSSPKIAEVKLGGTWKTLLIIGEGYGGTFYQAFDVTEAGMGVGPTVDGLGAVNGMLGRFDAAGESIQFAWSFPDYSAFDPDLRADIALSDGFPGNEVHVYGDLRSTATNVEKRVGYTFSDPAVGPLTLDRSVNAVMTGSGYYPAIETDPGLLRGAGAPNAGRAFFLLEASTGTTIGGSSSCAGVGCIDVGVVANTIKNAIQADVTATGDFGSPIVTKAYVGDLDGRYFRFDLQSDGTIASTTLTTTGQPIYSSSALLFLGTSQRFLFFSTGSDILANTTPGGTGVFRLIGVRDSNTVGASGTVTFTKNLASVAAGGIPTSGERPTSAPTVAGDIVFFTTNEGVGSGCTESVARLYAFTFLGAAAYDANGNGRIDNNESTVIDASPGRSTAPFIVDQHLFLGSTTTTGTGLTLFGDPADFNNGVGQVGVRILSWREIR